MKSTPNLTIERYRVREGQPGSSRFDGNNGAFVVAGITRPLVAIARVTGGWERVAVSVQGQPGATPSWEEMGYVKDLFWPAEECVIQYHPPDREYVGRQRGWLNLWRPIDGALPLPPPELFG